MTREQAQSWVTVKAALEECGLTTFHSINEVAGHNGLEKHWDKVVAFADGKDIEVMLATTTGSYVLQKQPRFLPDGIYRIADPKIEVNGFKVPAPSLKLAACSVFYCLSPTQAKGYAEYQLSSYVTADWLEVALKRGLIYFSEDDIKERARAEFPDLRDYVHKREQSE